MPSSAVAAVGAVDQGTTSTRALRLEADGTTRIVYSRRHRQIYPQPGYVEHDPHELLAHVCEAIAALGDVAAIGLDNQGESCLAWDAADDRPLSNVLVWQDQRAEAAVRRLDADGAAPLVRERAGLPLDSYFSASKLGWIVRHLPEAQALLSAGRLMLGTTDAFFLRHLTGHAVTDTTTASRTSLMNLGDCAWDAALCELFGVPLETLPPIVPSSGRFGDISTSSATAPLTASLTDQQAALYGHGCRVPGDAKITVGTGAFVQQVMGSGRPTTDGGALPTVAWHKTGEAPVYALDGGVYSAGAAVEWARSLGLFSDVSELNGFAEPFALDTGLAFVPALSGLGAPHWDRAARGTFLGLSLETRPQDLCQAVLEGVALRAAEVLHAMGGLGGSTAISMDGGLSRNPFFVRFCAGVFGRPVRVPARSELTAEGAARLAAEAVGLTIPFPDEGELVEPTGDLIHLRRRFAEAVRLSRTWGESGAIGDPPSS